MATIAVAVSGGADSLYALLRLQEEGHKVLALHGLFLMQDQDLVAINALEKLCHERKIDLHVVDFRHVFDQKVISPFLKAYAQGYTPNPCALCNAGIKFGVLMDGALTLGAELFATGHYAGLKPNFSPENLHDSPLCKAEDKRKDQSYFLALVPRERFSHCLFPLAHTQKNDNLAYLQERNISVPVVKESQEICFVPPTESNAYRDFMRMEAKKRHITLGRSGKIYVQSEGTESLVPEKQGGKHSGLWQYTEGQRRGLGVAWSEPLYVRTKDKKRNALILSPKNEAVLSSCVVKHLNFLVPPEYWPWQKLFVRLRYRQMEAPAHINYNDDSLHIEFQKPQSLTAPGQVAVIYNEHGDVLAGGIIHV